MITRIVIIGDSETESALNATGFATMLNDRFNGDADISLRYVIFEIKLYAILVNAKFSLIWYRFICLLKNKKTLEGYK